MIMVTRHNMDPSQTVERFLPHRPPMLLVHRVETADENSAVCVTDVDERLALFLGEDERLPVVVLLEIAAQSIGVWAGHRRPNAESSAPEPGLLLSCRNFHATVDSLPIGCAIRSQVQRLIEDGNLGSFACSLQVGNELVAQVDVTTYQADWDTLSAMLTDG